MNPSSAPPTPLRPTHRRSSAPVSSESPPAEFAQTPRLPPLDKQSLLAESSSLPVPAVAPSGSRAPHSAAKGRPSAAPPFAPTCSAFSTPVASPACAQTKNPPPVPDERTPPPPPPSTRFSSRQTTAQRRPNRASPAAALFSVLPPHFKSPPHPLARTFSARALTVPATRFPPASTLFPSPSIA